MKHAMSVETVMHNGALVEAILDAVKSPRDKLRAYVAFGKYASRVMGYRATAKMLFNATALLERKPTTHAHATLRILDRITGRMLVPTVAAVPRVIDIPNGTGDSITVTEEMLTQSVVFHAGHAAVCMALLLHSCVTVLQAGGETGWRLVMHFALPDHVTDARLQSVWADDAGDIFLTTRVNSGAFLASFRINKVEGVVPTVVMCTRYHTLVCMCRRTAIACVAERETSDLLFMRLHENAQHRIGSMRVPAETMRLCPSRPEQMVGMWRALRAVDPSLTHRPSATFVDRAARCTALVGDASEQVYLVERWLVQGRPYWLLCCMRLQSVTHRRTVLAAFTGPCPLWAVVVGATTYALAEHDESLLLYRPGAGVRRLRTDAGVLWPARGGLGLAEYVPVYGGHTLLLRRTDDSGEAMAVDIDRVFD